MNRLRGMLAAIGLISPPDPRYALMPQAQRGYYHPGENPQPRPASGSIYRNGTRKKRRVPRAVRLQLMQQNGVKSSGRQWRKLRKTMRLTVAP